MKNKAFTLVEFLVYSVITVIIIGSLILVSSNVLAGRARSFSMQEVNHNAGFSIQRIMRETRNANTIDSPTIGETGSYLKLIDSEENIIEFKLENSTIETRRGGEGLYHPFITETVNITELEFSNISQSEETPGTLRIKMTAEFFNPLQRREFEFQETYLSTENIRK